MMTIIIFFIILAVLVLVHEFGHFIAAKKSGIRVDEFGVGFPPTLFSFKPKNSETRYSFNIIPFGGFVKIFGEDPDLSSISGPDKDRSFVNKSKKIQIMVLSAGVLFNIIFAWILISFGFMWGLPISIDESNRDYASDVYLVVGALLPDSPAMEAGLKVGDRILSIEQGERSINNPTDEEVKNFIQESNKEEFELTYQRGEVIEEVRLKAESGLLENDIAIGIAMDDVGIVRFPFIKAIKEGTITTLFLLKAITLGLIGFISNAFMGNANLSEISGPVGIVGLVGDASALGLVYLISFTALISLHLAVLNLMPFPALDGGRILFVIIEALKGSPINPKVQNWLNGVGFALLILLMLFVTYNDILNLF